VITIRSIIMTNAEKIEKIKELIVEIDELSKELSEEELEAVSGGFHPESWDAVFVPTSKLYARPERDR
jgi:bacteriocin-like protein